MIKNQIKTVVLLGALSGLLLLVGYLISGQQGLYIGLAISIVMNFLSYFFSDKMVLAMYGAKEITEKDDPVLFKIINEVRNLASIPMPKVYIIQSDNPNAFATGRNPKHAAVACTTGILKLLNKDELKGVIAHELSHIKNRDILVATIAATIASVISYIAMIARWGAIFGGYGSRDRDSNGLEILFLAILTPLIAIIIQLAISRSREYLADESAAKTLHNTFGLADALEKLEKSIKQHPMMFGNRTTASLFILNPFTAKGLFTLFSTHPSTEERVRRLRSLDF